MKITTLKDLFIHHVKDLYNAESQLEKVAPTLMDAVHFDGLKNVLKKHGELIGHNKESLEKIADKMDFSTTGEKCHAMEGIIKEAQHFLNEDTETDTRDAGIIADANRITHYFIAGYGTLNQWAERMNLDNEIQNWLTECLTNAKWVDGELKTVAKNNVNQAAMMN